MCSMAYRCYGVLQVFIAGLSTVQSIPSWCGAAKIQCTIMLGNPICQHSELQQCSKKILCTTSGSLPQCSGCLAILLVAPWRSFGVPQQQPCQILISTINPDRCWRSDKSGLFDKVCARLLCAGLGSKTQYSPKRQVTKPTTYGPYIGCSALHYSNLDPSNNTGLVLAWH